MPHTSCNMVGRYRCDGYTFDACVIYEPLPNTPSRSGDRCVRVHDRRRSLAPDAARTSPSDCEDRFRSGAARRAGSGLGSFGEQPPCSPRPARRSRNARSSRFQCRFDRSGRSGSARLPSSRDKSRPRNSLPGACIPCTRRSRSQSISSSIAIGPRTTVDATRSPHIPRSQGARERSMLSSRPMSPKAQPRRRGGPPRSSVQSVVAKLACDGASRIGDRRTTSVRRVTPEPAWVTRHSATTATTTR
jgi:hypothetical protein